MNPLSDGTKSASLLSYVKKIHHLQTDEEAILKLGFEAGYRNENSSWNKTDAVQKYENLIRRQHLLIIKLKQHIDPRAQISHASLHTVPLSPSSSSSSISVGPSGPPLGLSNSSSVPSSPTSSIDFLISAPRLNHGKPSSVASPPPHEPSSPLNVLADSAATIATHSHPDPSNPRGNIPSTKPQSPAKAGSAASSESKPPGKRSVSLTDFEIDTERLSGAKKPKSSEKSSAEFAVPFQVTPFGSMGTSIYQNTVESNPSLLPRLTYQSTGSPAPSQLPVFRPAQTWVPSPQHQAQSTQIPPMRLPAVQPPHSGVEPLSPLPSAVGIASLASPHEDSRAIYPPMGVQVHFQQYSLRTTPQLPPPPPPPQPQPQQQQQPRTK